MDATRRVTDSAVLGTSDESGRLARISKNRLIAVWEDPTGRDGDNRGVFGVVLDGNIDRVGPEFPVNQIYTDGEQRNATVATGSGSARPVSGDLRMNTTTANRQTASNIAVSTTGDVVVVWTTSAGTETTVYSLTERVVVTSGLVLSVDP